MGLCCAVLLAIAPATGGSTAQDDLRAFDQVWTTIKENYWDPDLGGLDWEDVRRRLRPRVTSAHSREAARAVIQEMIQLLGRSHFTLLPARVSQHLNSAETASSDLPRGGLGVTGINLRLVEDTPTVVSVAPGSSAATAGVRPGWLIETINHEPVQPLLQDLANERTRSTGADLLLVNELRTRLRGDPGTSVHVGFVDHRNVHQDLTLTLGEQRGKKVQLSHLPPMYLWLEHRTLPQGVGYLALNAFFDPATTMPEISEALHGFIDHEAPGVIIDLRDNPGGIGAMAMGLAGWFVAHKGQQLGTMRTRHSSLSFVVFPRPKVFERKLAILVDELSASTAEIFAGGLQDLGRARVFGARTAGMALPSRVIMLANGDAFQYAFADYTSAGGTELEGRGVIPDTPVRLTRAALLSGTDPALAAAEAWIVDESPPRRRAHEEQP